MRLRRVAVLLVLLVPALAFAQNDQSVIVVPPPPPIVAAPSAPIAPPAPAAPAAPPPGLVQTPAPSVAPAAPDAASAPPAPDVAPVPQNTWLPANTALLGVLDKVDGSTTKISIAVGAAQTIGDLQVSIQACVNRPPDQIPDTAVFLTVQNSADDSGAPLYRGWMVRSMPGAAVVGDAGETFRVISCS